jgi:hypothetical protein
MTYHFYDKTIRDLVNLKSDMLSTLKNRHCEILTTPVSNTIKQIDSELKLRGIHSIKTEKAIA